MIKMLEQPNYGRRAYVIVGINKNDPTDIIGYCENSFSMGWTKHWVNVWANHGKYIAKRNVTELYVDKFCELYNKGKEYCKTLDKYYKDKYGRFLRKAFSKKASFDKVKQEVFDYYMNVSSYSSLGEWNNMRHYPSQIPEGYEMKIFRLNSKNCPIICDLRYRFLMERMPESKTKIEKAKLWSKWDYRNPMFVVKAKVGTDFKWPENFMHSVEMKKTEVSNCKFAKIQYFDLPVDICDERKFHHKGKEFERMSRSEKQILRKQRRNSFAAKEGKLAHGRASKHCS